MMMTTMMMMMASLTQAFTGTLKTQNANEERTFKIKTFCKRYTSELNF